MATFKIKWLENKAPDWKILTLDDNGKEIKDVSVNRVNKKGETFPNFDAITSAGTVEGELWVSPSGKNYLFAPRPTTPPKASGFKTHQMEKMAGDKREFIGKAMDDKQFAIKVSSTFRAATDTAIAEYHEQRRLSSTGASMESLFEKWREFYWMRFDVAPEDYAPFRDKSEALSPEEQWAAMDQS